MLVPGLLIGDQSRFLTLRSSIPGLARPSSISIRYSVNWEEAKGSRWSAAPLCTGGSWLGVSRYVVAGEKAGCCSKEGGVGNILWRSATAERREMWIKRWRRKEVYKRYDWRKRKNCSWIENVFQ